MSIGYQAVTWNRDKRIYDAVLASSALAYFAVFLGGGTLIHPNATIETLLIRAFGSLAFLLLHVVLCIGPLCRLNPRFLPLLYNRRHLGVTMFMAGLVHGVFSLVQFHALGDLPSLASLFTSNTRFNSLSQFPFELLGFGALLILCLMAATSHDFWLHTLGIHVWKRLHMFVYAAYALLVCHVTLGFLQSETNPLLVGATAAGFVIVIGLHLAAAIREKTKDREGTVPSPSFVRVCAISEIPEKHAKIISLGGERVAIFKYDGKVSAIGNVCRHQGGPLGEGRIIDGCVTCPWHGYQYLPESGASPPPFPEKVPSYHTRITDGVVFVDPRPEPPGTHIEPARFQ